MAGLDSIKKYQAGSTVAAADAPAEVTGSIPYQPGKNTGIAEKISLDPTQTENILANMQQYINERQGILPSLSRGLTRGMATAYGPSSLAAVDREQMLQDKQIMEYQQTMAAYRAAQAQAQRDAEEYNQKMQGGPGSAPAAGGTAPAVGGGMTYDGIPVPQSVQAQLTRNATTNKAILDKWLQTRTTESIKKEQSPAMAAKVDIWIPGEGKVEMTTAQAEKYLENNPRLQAIVGGQKVPAAQAITQATTAAPAAATTEIPVFKDPSIKITSAQRTPEKQQELWDETVKRGTPGFQADGTPVAKPGTSTHQTRPAGEVLDISPKGLTKSGRLELAQNGYYQPYGIDSPHWEKIPTLTTAKADVARPTTTSTTTAPAVDQTKPLPNESQTQYEQRMKGIGQIQESRIKEGETERTSIQDAGKSSIETGNAISRIENVLNTKEGARAVGVFNKPGVVAAFGKILSEGVQAGNFGSVSFKGLEDAVRAAGGDQPTIDAAQRLARDFAQMQLNIAKRDLKGQGAVSDNERRIVERVTGSTANSPEVLKDFARWNRVRNDFDRDVARAAQDWEKANPNQSFTAFKQSDAYKTLENNYIAKTDAMANKMGLSGAKATPSGAKVDIEALKKKYSTKKES